MISDVEIPSVRFVSLNFPTDLTCVEVHNRVEMDNENLSGHSL